MTEADKDRIRQEEIFREEVKKQFTNKKEGNKLWAFLNSSLGIWFLSSVVLTAGTFIYNSSAEKRKFEREKAEKIMKLDLEIESRISQFLVHLKAISTKDNDTVYSFRDDVNRDTVRHLWEAFKGSPSRSPKLSTSVYAEFNDRPIASLMIELSTLIDTKFRQGYFELDENYTYKNESTASEEVTRIKNAGIYIMTTNLMIDTKEQNFNELWDIVSKNIIVRRWTNQFSYTDCVGAPFC